MKKIPLKIRNETVWRASLKCIQAGMTYFFFYKLVVP